MWSKEEEKILMENYGILNCSEIAKKLSKKPANVRHKAYRMGLKSSLSGRTPSEKTLQKLKQSIHKAKEPITKVSQTTLFECGYCGTEFYTKPSKIASGHTGSCGCTRIGMRTGSEYLSGTWFDRTKRGAKIRGHKFDVSIDFLNSLIQKQNFRCALSNRKLICGYVDLLQYTASLDRIDSSIHYTEGNVQFLHKEVNMAKQGLNQEQFISMCKEISSCN